MSKADLYQKLNRASEITLSVKGRKSGRDIPRPVWFVHEGNTIYLLPNHGSDTNWYMNMLVDPTLRISVDGVRLPASGKPIKDTNRVDDILKKFQSKYGEVKRYYTKLDVAVEVPI
ncbi:MAG TPA: nitroreductase/quinone reductase family protein [Nitrososphaeraceae archaeon]|jgi:hypothetical protein|nr:nitroreductase/quinone reductase family protein [Nitrososphaeraceae archaeon]